MQQHEETSCAFWTLCSLFFSLLLYCMHSKIELNMQFYHKETVANHEQLSTCYLHQNNSNNNGYMYSQNCLTQFHTKIHGTHLATYRNELNYYHIIYWTFINLTQNTEQKSKLQTLASKA